MAIKQAAKTQSASPEPKSDAPVLIVLTGYVRFVMGGVLYTNDTIYTCSPQEAEEMLALESEGKKVFSKYVKKSERPKVDEVPMAPLPKVAAKGAAPVKTTGKKMEIGTDEEAKELGLPPEDDEVSTI